MNDSGETPIDDADLQAHARSHWGGERCPADLRRRLTALCEARRPTRRLGAWPAWGLAAAAAVAAAVTATRTATVGRTAVAALPASLETALVRTHDGCNRGPADHQHLPVPRNNGYAIAATLRSRLDRPVLVGRPADDAWRFAGASVCPVGGFQSAHLVFRRADGDALSIFSLPRSSAPAAVDGQQFQGESGGHPIVAFVRHGAVYCLVASGCRADVSVPQLEAVRAQLEREVVVADQGSTDGVPADGELMHPSGR